MKTPLSPLAVRPREAWTLLNCGHSFGFELLKKNELESYLDGTARKITVESIHRYIARRLAESKKVLRRSPRTRKQVAAGANATKHVSAT